MGQREDMLEEEILDEEDAPGPSLDDVLNETTARSRHDDEASKERSEAAEVVGSITDHERERARSRGPLLGEILEERSLDHPGRVLVRWRGENDRVHERWVMVLRGLELELGDTVLLDKPTNGSGWVVTGAVQRGASRENVERLDVDAVKNDVEILVDGERVEVEGRDEIVLRCGEASITLRRNGRIVIRGTYVETYSKGTNRIKGGTVQIN